MVEDNAWICRNQEEEVEEEDDDDEDEPSRAATGGTARHGSEALNGPLVAWATSYTSPYTFSIRSAYVTRQVHQSWRAWRYSWPSYVLIRDTHKNATWAHTFPSMTAAICMKRCHTF